MILIIYLLLTMKDGCCKDYPTIQTKTIYVGDPVKLTCSRRDAGEFLWMRTSSGDSPDIFGKHENMYSQVKVSLEPGIVVLQITKARINDSGLYFCQRVYKGNKSILNVTYLSVEESAAIADPTSAPPHLRDSLTLYCSGLRDSQNKSCPGDESLLCFRAESIQTLPSLNYTDNEEDRLKFDSEGCVYSYFKNYSMSGAQIYQCAVAKYDENTSGRKSNPNTKENQRDSSNYNTVVFLMSAALALCLVVIAFLIYLNIQVNKKLNDCCSATVAGQSQESIRRNQESQKLHEDVLVYSAVSTRRKASKKRTAGTSPEEQDVIYTEVNVLGL
ncbi:uncharacterized protein LOC105922661 isoform X2 [Fundulus heteroclitus]|uniref:uncharacterized protein LOC105922661 isoform X2 n=1 Tax=Fundulus heteroclitus TaxID=8078 RepID=UPI00165A6D88|nr:uncharacterized protein LOC105922661 isoform X2 [Fundulus heteroclitus]